MEKKNLFVVATSDAKVYCFENFDVCEDFYLDIVNSDLCVHWHLKWTIDKWTKRIEHEYVTYSSSMRVSDSVIHLYRDLESDTWIIMKEVTLNPVPVWQQENDELEKLDAIYSKKI